MASKAGPSSKELDSVQDAENLFSKNRQKYIVIGKINTVWHSWLYFGPTLSIVVIYGMREAQLIAPAETSMCIRNCLRFQGFVNDVALILTQLKSNEKREIWDKSTTGWLHFTVGEKIRFYVWQVLSEFLNVKTH